MVFFFLIDTLFSACVGRRLSFYYVHPECADGSVMFKFGSTEEQQLQQEQSFKELSNGAGNEEIKSSDSADTSIVNGSHNQKSEDNSVASADVPSNFDDVPDAASLSDLAHGAEELAQELNVKEDEQKAEVSRNEEERLFSGTASDTADKVSIPLCGDIGCLMFVYCGICRSLQNIMVFMFFIVSILCSFESCKLTSLLSMAFHMKILICFACLAAMHDYFTWWKKMSCY